MNKIGDIHRGNGNVLLAGIIGVVVTILIGWMSLSVLQLNILSYLTKEKIVEVLMILPTMLLIFIIHEYIHVGFYLLFGKGEAKIRVIRERSVGAVMMHQINEKVYYSRNQMITILLAPLIILTIILLIMHIFIPVTFLVWTNIVLNTLGSAIDIYVSIKLLSVPSKSVFVNFNSESMVMNIYRKATQ